MGEHKFKKPRFVEVPIEEPTGTPQPEPVEEAVSANGIGWRPALDASYAFLFFQDGLTLSAVTNGDCDPLSLLAVIDDLTEGGGETEIDPGDWEDPDPTACYLLLLFPRKGYPQARLTTRNMTQGHIRAALAFLRERALINLRGILVGNVETGGNGLLGKPRGPVAPQFQRRQDAPSGLAAISAKLKGAAQGAPR